MTSSKYDHLGSQTARLGAGGSGVWSMEYGGSVWLPADSDNLISAYCIFRLYSRKTALLRISPLFWWQQEQNQRWIKIFPASSGPLCGHPIMWHVTREQRGNSSQVTLHWQRWSKHFYKFLYHASSCQLCRSALESGEGGHNVDQAAGLIGGKNFRRWIKKMDFRENDINKYVYEDRTK